MSDLKQSGGATMQPIQESAISTEFDPVSEIRKLRKNLTHRIQLLHSTNTTTSNVPVASPKENTDKTDTEIIEETENLNKTETNTILPVTAENQTIKTVEDQTTEFPITELVQQIHQARQLLAQLKITPDNDQTLPKTAKDKSEKNKPEKDKLPKVPISQTEPLETPKLFFPPLGVLKMMNTVLTCCGFFGILFSLQYLEHNNRFGLTTIIVASLILIAVGLLGRFYSFTFHEKSLNKFCH
ncbi:MAG: hypothetical protein LBC02_03080 [Planctomycetaceae bacterium]|jgi:hypothetical protein|nr:hypothetical protein [Planctomycetaceae bacterium]